MAECRLSLLDPLLDPRSRLEILRVVSADTRRGGYQDRQTACEKPEFELLRGALGEVCEGRMSIEADLVRRASIQTVSGFLSRSLSWREEPSRQGKRHSLSVCRKQRPPRRANPLSGKARWAAEILPPRGGMKTGATAGEKEIQTTGFFVFGALTLIVALLKLAVFSDWSWWRVSLPILILCRLQYRLHSHGLWLSVLC